MTNDGTIYLETMGCQMNALDSELALGALLARGYRVTADMQGASLVVLNTCSVRQHAEDKVYSRLGQLKRSRVRHPEQVVAVIGCMAERDGDGLLAKMPHVDILCGPSDLGKLPGLIDDVQRTRRPAVALSGRLRDHSTPVRDGSGGDDLETLDSGRMFGLNAHAEVPKVFGRHQAYVRITRGCNKYCTFCVVPYTRGPEQHRPPGQIVDEVRRLANAGVMEVTLLGQTVNHYEFEGEGPDGRTTFAQLLKRVHDEVPELPRLRFVTSFPRDFTDEALEVMAASPRICKYLHVPAQSGSNEVLKRMNRGYTVEQYMSLLDRARKLMPDLAIAGDMIVGFCGETEADFQKSLDLLRYARYKNCFIFKYSPRPGTAADGRFPDDVPEDEKRRRNNDMLAVQAQINVANHQSMMGSVVEVLVEGPSKAQMKRQESEQERGCEVENAESPNRQNAETRRGPFSPGPKDQGERAAMIQLVGRTSGDQIVVFDGNRDMIGGFASVRVIAATPYTLHGECVTAAGFALPRTAQRDTPASNVVSLPVLCGTV
ncbi:MAG TPA: tRNA (N6-isopentenyl adenosine(37)-C2)-methylthiotransferase MiaB [Phycisphaerae bacterium]|nr:tRNA (N6-isopentenyl adenosine(37)-C2)-methylthiotransferase MiaB [Phycisphaerae bacterium]